MNNFKPEDIIVIEDNNEVIKIMNKVYSQVSHTSRNSMSINEGWPIDLITQIYEGEERSYWIESNSRETKRIWGLGVYSPKHKYGLSARWFPHMKMRHATKREQFLFHILGIHVLGKEDEY